MRDFLTRRPDRDGGMRFLFDCGVFEDEQLAAVSLQPEELCEYRLATLEEASALLSGPVRRRVLAAASSDRCVYLEDGRPLAAVSS